MCVHMCHNHIEIVFLLWNIDFKRVKVLLLKYEKEKFSFDVVVVCVFFLLFPIKKAFLRFPFLVCCFFRIIKIHRSNFSAVRTKATREREKKQHNFYSMMIFIAVVVRKKNVVFLFCCVLQFKDELAFNRYYVFGLSSIYFDFFLLWNFDF